MIQDFTFQDFDEQQASLFPLDVLNNNKTISLEQKQK